MKFLILICGLLFALAASAANVQLFTASPTNTITPADVLPFGTPDGTGTNYATRTISLAQLSASGVIKTPFLTVSPVGLANGAAISNGGLNFGPDTPGTHTSGLQEAINALPLATNAFTWGGGAIYLARGNFIVTTNVATPNTTNPFSLKLVGSGMTACGITGTFTNGMPVLTIGNGQNPNSSANCVFSMCDMWCMSSSISNSPILWLNGGSIFQGTYPGIGRADIDFCWFSYWPSATNNPCGKFTPSSCNDSTVHNLIGVLIEAQLGDTVAVKGCSFNYCIALSVASDHAAILNNLFEHCGVSDGSPVNNWPANSPYSSGAAVVFPEAYNGNDSWEVRGNNFVDSYRAYYVDDSRLSFMKLTTYEDNFEVEGTYLTSGAQIAAVNPLASAGAINAYLVTNRNNNFGSWSNNVCPTNMFTLVNFRRGLSVNGIPVGSIPSGVLTTNGYDGALFTNKVCLRVPAFTNAGIIYYSMFSTNANP